MLAYPLFFLTWRESVVGMKPTERVQMDVLRTWDVRPITQTGSQTGQTLGGSVQSETLGYVRWRMMDTTLFAKPYRLLHSQTFDKASGTLSLEDVYTNERGEIVRQYEERTTPKGKRIADAAFYPDHIEIARTDAKGKTIFAEMFPAEGMEAVQRRFSPMQGDKKEFLHLDGIAGAFRKVQIVRTGRFKGSWNGVKYDGLGYRFTLDGKEQTLMMTPDDEIVQINFDKGVQVVLSGPTASRRTEPFNVPVPPR